MKVYERSGYRYKSTPTIMLKGQWLNELGFGYRQLRRAIQNNDIVSLLSATQSRS